MSTRKNDPIGLQSRILEHAGREFIKHGYEGAKLNQIIADAGITKGALFHHFSSKEDLALKWFDATLPPLVEELWGNPLAGASDPLERMEEIFSQMATTAGERHGVVAWTASGLEECTALRSKMSELHRTWHGIVMAALVDGQKCATVHPVVRAGDEAQMILSLAMGIAWNTRVNGIEATTACLRSVMSYLATLRPA